MQKKYIICALIAGSCGLLIADAPQDSTTLSPGAMVELQGKMAEQMRRAKLQELQDIHNIEQERLKVEKEKEKVEEEKLKEEQDKLHLIVDSEDDRQAEIRREDEQAYQQYLDRMREEKAAQERYRRNKREDSAAYERQRRNRAEDNAAYDRQQRNRAEDDAAYRRQQENR